MQRSRIPEREVLWSDVITSQGLPEANQKLGEGWGRLSLRHWGWGHKLDLCLDLGVLTFLTTEYLAVV